MSSTARPSQPRQARLKLWLALPIALVMLALLGHFFTRGQPSSVANAAPLAPPASAPTSDAAAEISVSNEVADAVVADVSAVEQLADGAVIVDLNHADEAQLRRLPGIGPTRARAILALRLRLGRFRSVDDLSRIQGFGRALLRKLRVFSRTL